MMEPFDNPAVFEQAVNRCHRIGQTRAVAVKVIMLRGSIEEKIWAIQQRMQAEQSDGEGAPGAVAREQRFGHAATPSVAGNIEEDARARDWVELQEIMLGARP